MSPHFDVKEETLPAFQSEDYANPNVADLKIFRRLQTHISINRKPGEAQWSKKVTLQSSDTIVRTCA